MLRQEGDDKAAETQNEVNGVVRKQHYKAELRTQMSLKETSKRQQWDQVTAERQAVDSQIQRLIDEDLRKIELERLKKQTAFADMQAALAEKERLRRTQEDKAKAEEARLQEYLSAAEQRAAEAMEKKGQQESTKQAIYDALRRAKEAKLRDIQEVECLKHELMLEEQREKERRTKQEQEARLRKGREEMARWEETAKALKEKARREEREMEETFKRMMLEEFERKEKLEQMNQQKRRMMEHQHKREVEALWQEKLARVRAEKEALLREAESRMAEARWEERVVVEEKKRILETHLPQIQDTCSPQLWGMARTLAATH